MKNSKILALALLTVFSFTSCDNDDPENVNEEELITTVTTELSAGGSVITLTSKDLDGDGPNAPVVTVSGDLKVNTTYTGAIKVANESGSSSINLNPEIIAEGDEHQFFYQAPLSIGSFKYSEVNGNKDVNGRYIGIIFTLTTGKTPTEGEIKIILRHKPIKGAPGVSDGDITNAGGATDAEVTYKVKLVN